MCMCNRSCRNHLLLPSATNISITTLERITPIWVAHRQTGARRRVCTDVDDLLNNADPRQNLAAWRSTGWDGEETSGGGWLGQMHLVIELIGEEEEGGRRRRRELFPSWVWVTLTIDRPPSRNLKKSSSMHTRVGELHRGQKCRQTKISKKSGRKGWEWNMRLKWGVLAFSFGVGCCLVASVLQP